jgi:predicted phage terminase large subunit-like protein
MAQQRLWRADWVIIERANAGYPLMSELSEDPAWRRRLIGYRPRIDKEIRFAAQTAFVEDARILRPQSAPWLEALRHELMAFPKGRHDDQADALAQFLEYAALRRLARRLAHPGVTVRSNPRRRNIVRKDFVRRAAPARL